MNRKATRAKFSMALCLGLLAVSVGCAAAEPEPRTGNELGPMDIEEVPLTGDYLEYTSLAEAMGKSELNVIGTPLSSRVVTVYADGSYVDDPVNGPQTGIDAEKSTEIRQSTGIVETVTRVRVEEVLSGKVKPGDIVDVQQTGGTLDGRTFKDPSVILLSGFNGTGNRILLNLQPLAGRFAPVSPKYGTLRLVEDRLYGLEGSDLGQTLKDARAALETD